MPSETAVALIFIVAAFGGFAAVLAFADHYTSSRT